MLNLVVHPGGTYSDHRALEGELELIRRSSSYCEVNRHRLGYKYQSVGGVFNL